MVFTVAELIAFITEGITLEPGDVILTGTPHGVGNFRDPQLFMKLGDVIEVEVGGLGMLANAIGPTSTRRALEMSAPTAPRLRPRTTSTARPRAHRLSSTGTARSSAWRPSTRSQAARPAHQRRGNHRVALLHSPHVSNDPDKMVRGGIHRTAVEFDSI